MSQLKPIELEGEVEKIDLNSLTETLCTQHKFILDLDKQECNCDVCGYGFRWSPSTLKIDQYNKTIEKFGNKHPIIFIKKGRQYRPPIFNP